MRADFHKKYLIALAVAAGIGVSFASPSAVAFEDPFSIDSGSWISSKTYEQNVRRHKVEPKEEDVEKKEAVATPPAPTVLAPPAVNPAVAAFMTPSMPGFTKETGIRDRSNEKADDDNLLMAAIPPTEGGRPPEKKWVATSTKDFFTRMREDEDKEISPLKVRMSFLPTQNMTPTPSASHESAAKKGHDLLKKLSQEKKDREKAEQEKAAACAALDAYKKEQIDAIQSDRQTLTALQNAIKSLGLSTQLGFIAKQNDALNAASNPAPVAASSSGQTSVQ